MRIRAATALMLTASVVVAPFAHAAIHAARFVSPLSFGTVDFEDRVPYRLAGDACRADRVRIVVTTRLAQAGTHPRTVMGPASTPVRDPLSTASCIGLAAVPTERAVRATRWQEGDAIEIAVVSEHDRVPLLYQRLQTAFGKVAAGTPTVVTPTVRDPRAGARQRVVELRAGDSLDLGRVDLTHITSISLRLCIILPEPHLTPSLVEIRERSPSGPSIIGTVDVGDDWPAGSPQTKANDGWPNCWWLQPWPVNGPVTQRAPELYLTLVASVSPVQIEYVDFNGTGAKAPDVTPAAPAGFRAMPWKQWTMSGCVIDDDGTVHNDPDTSPAGYAPEFTGGLAGPHGCVMSYAKHKLRNVRIRFEFKFGDFADNGGVLVGGHEVQMRIAGEWLPGGLYGNPLPQSALPVGIPAQTGVDTSGGGYPAERLKQNSYSDWNLLDIVQLGSHHIVRLNGRTVADSATAWPAPAPYDFTVESQPQFGYNYQAGIRYDNAYNPTISQPSSWSNLVWRHFRYHQCTSATDPVCTHLPGVHG